jgi:hypothetical protein
MIVEILFLIALILCVREIDKTLKEMEKGSKK